MSTTTSVWFWSGKAYARSLRGHFLIDAALTGLMLDYLNSSVANDGNPSPVVPSCVSAQLFGSVSRTMMSGLELLFQLTE